MSSLMIPDASVSEILSRQTNRGENATHATALGMGNTSVRF